MNINFGEQFKHLWRVILVLVLVLNVVFLCIFALNNLYSIPLEFMLEDNASLYGFSQYSGFSTSIGILFLSFGIGAVLLLLLLDQKLTFDKRELTSMIIIGLMTLYLVMDDVFLLHERFFTGLFQVGEGTIFLVYFLAFGVIVFYLRENMLSGPTLFFVITLLLLGLSISMDFLLDKGIINEAMVESVTISEEYFKLGGYLFWTTFILLKARKMILAQSGQD